MNERFPESRDDSALWQSIHSYAKLFPQFIHPLQMLFRAREFKGQAIA